MLGEHGAFQRVGVQLLRQQTLVSRAAGSAYAQQGQTGERKQLGPLGPLGYLINESCDGFDGLVAYGEYDFLWAVGVEIVRGAGHGVVGEVDGQLHYGRFGAFAVGP